MRDCRLVITDDKAELTVCLPRGSGVRTVEVSPSATVDDAVTVLAGDMRVDKRQWKLYARPDKGPSKVIAPTDKLATMLLIMKNASYYFYPLP